MVGGIQAESERAANGGSLLPLGGGCGACLFRHHCAFLSRPLLPLSLSLSVLVLLVALFFGPAVCLSTLRKLLEILPATAIAMVWAVVAPLRARAVGTNDENHSGYLDVVGAAIRCSLFVSGDEYE